MPRRSEKSLYIERANKLRSLGFEVGYKGNRRASPQQKSAVTRLWQKNAIFYATNPDKNRLTFVRYTSKTTRKKVAQHVGPAQIFPKGFFLQRPPGVEKKDFKWEIQRDGSLVVGTKDGRVRDVVVPLDMIEVAKDPAEGLKQALAGRKRPEQLLLTVNGYDSEKRKFDDLNQFNLYLEETLIPRLEDAEFDFEKYGKEIFGVHLVYPPKGSKRKRGGKEKVFDFKTGGIFSESRVLYGAKKFKPRKEWVLKKGKRKGT
jgi:hypothetical protein